MTIKEAIGLLSQIENQEEEIIIAWWEADSFFDQEEFDRALDNAENMDWSYVQEQLTQ